MLSYRHAFHAGNHADILKHYILSSVLEYYNQKDKPYCVIDTHAGAGMYQLNDAFPQKNKEFETGISRLLSAKKLPDSLAKFVALVQSFNSGKQFQLYPGSPKVSAYYLRSKDQLRLFELHPNDHKTLERNFIYSKQTKILMKDGYTSVKGFLPPTTKRGVIMIDPPYESKDEYVKVVTTIKESLKRFATGTYIVWYPLIHKTEPVEMIKSLRQSTTKEWLDVKLSITTPSGQGYGMYGSGLFIINPPWTLLNTLDESLPYLVTLLGQDSSASFSLDTNS